jgi:hypothetical protein
LTKNCRKNHSAGIPVPGYRIHKTRCIEWKASNESGAGRERRAGTGATDPGFDAWVHDLKVEIRRPGALPSSPRTAR